jgi:hypothetical protein
MANKLGGKGGTKPKSARKPRAQKSDNAPAAAPPEGSEELQVGRVAAVSGETKAKHWNKIRQLKAAVQKLTDEKNSKNGEFRAAVKAAKDAGCDTDAMLEVLKLSKWEPEEIATFFSGVNEFLVIAKVPVPKVPQQLGLFHDGTGIGERVDNAAFEAADPKDFTPAQLDAAQASGKKKGLDGRPITDNPHEEGSPLALRWTGGWREGQNELADKAFRGGAPAPKNGQAAAAH